MTQAECVLVQNQHFLNALDPLSIYEHCLPTYRKSISRLSTPRLASINRSREPDNGCSYVSARSGEPATKWWYVRCEFSDVVERFLCCKCTGFEWGVHDLLH